MSTEQREFYVTFGCRYAREPHPTFPAAHPDGYVVVVAPDEPTARRAVFTTFGQAWAFLYDAPPEPQFAPRGAIGRLEVTVHGRGCCNSNPCLHPEDCPR